VSALVYFVASLAEAVEPPAAPTVTVEVINGGLYQAAPIVHARFGTPINYEGVPRNIEGVHFVRRPDLFLGVRMVTPIGDGGFTFSYPADATPRQALDAAVAAYNALPNGYVRYTVRDTGRSLDLVPAEVWDGTAWKASTPLLDTIITIPSRKGWPNDLFLAVAQELSELSGRPVSCDGGLGVPSLSSDPDLSITIPSATGPARTLLSEIVSRSDLANSWRFAWHPSLEEPNWYLFFYLVQPKDEAVLNRTPLVPRPGP
jgi:hypothetical protein